jgi:hypothetical protein
LARPKGFTGSCAYVNGIKNYIMKTIMDYIMNIDANICGRCTLTTPKVSTSSSRDTVSNHDSIASRDFTIIKINRLKH